MQGSATVKFLGSTNAKYGSDVIIKGHGSKMPGESGCDSRNRCLISIQGSANVILENLTLESDWYRKDHSGDVQAEVLGTDTTGTTAAYNCGFKSHQDTLRTTGKAWFYGCYIEGDVDFIWMEAGGKVALYENCEIVSIYDQYAKTHNTYLTASKMAETLKISKGLVIYNCNVHKSDEAKANGQKTYMARTPWSSGCINQVTYINSNVKDIELFDGPWYKTQIATSFPKTIVGWKLDKATATSVGITDIDSKDYIVLEDLASTEYNGRRAILNRVYDSGKLKYVADSSNSWDIDSVIMDNGWNVSDDTSKVKLDDETMGDPTVYNFKVENASNATCNGFTYQDNGGNTHYVSQADGTITIPLNGKCFVEVYGYYQGLVEANANTQDGSQVMFFNNFTTSSEVENDYIVYDENARSFTITAKATTYITKIVVIPDSSIEDSKVESITITNLKPKQIVGVPQTLKAEILPKGVVNSSVVWSSSDEAIATVDKYTGKVTFNAAGNVTITATACDGSGVTASVECNPFIPEWNAIEWYTTDTTVVTETGADGIDMFDVNNSANKSLGTFYKFVNLAGQEISSKYGLKLNSAGKLSFATLKYAELSLIVAPKQNNLVNPPSVVNADGTVATLISSEVDETTGLQYFTYSLTATGMWDIERSDVTMENNPILYAKVEYKTAVISTSTGTTFKGSHYTTGKTGIEDIVTPGASIDATGTTIELNKMNFTNCKINGVVVEGNKTSVGTGSGDIVQYEITEKGTVTIEASANDYLGFVGVIFKSLEQKKEDACNSLDSLYPASKYTKNEDYETVLETQKEAINAAETDAELVTALNAAKEALDALEQDPVEETSGPVKSLNYIFADYESKYAAGDAVESTKDVTFVGCVKHDGTYIALKEDNAVKLSLAGGAKLVVCMPFSSGVTLNGEAVTLVDNCLIYTVPAGGIEVSISGTPGNAYITSITVTME